MSGDTEKVVYLRLQMDTPYKLGSWAASVIVVSTATGQ
jgi:hypothetical protein